MAPKGKGLYERGNPRIYAPYVSGADYADALGCSWIAVDATSNAAPTTVQRAYDLGLEVYLWSWPGQWTPSTWREGLRDIVTKANAWGVEGIIADAECASESGGMDCPSFWVGRRQEATAFAEALGAVSESMSVGVALFLGWPYRDLMHELAGRRGVWCNPMIYGHAKYPPLDTPAQVARDIARWKREWTASPIVPAIAAWNRPPPDQVAYQKTFAGFRGGIVWTDGTPPRPETANFEVLRGLSFPRPWWHWALGAGVLGGLGYLGWQRYGDEVRGLLP